MSEDSLGKVVQTIMESLSDAISQLMLYVIAMQESNSQMPAHIPTAAQGVADASNTLADVATGIAEEEYEGYPDIQIPIIDAAKDVRQSSGVLIGAVNNLKTASNKADGWARLLDACRIISGQTCYILQLVYAAELKRLLFASDAAKDLASQTPASLAAKDAQLYADRVSDLAGHADALAERLLEKIKDEESPLRKEELRKQAEELKKFAEDLPKLANNVLKAPNDPKAQKAYDDKVREFQNKLAEIARPLNEQLKLQPDKPPQITPTPTPPPVSHPPPPQKGYPPPKANDPPIRQHVPPFQQAQSIPPQNTPPPPTVIPQAAKKAKEDLHNLISATSAKNGPAVAHEAQQLAADLSPVVDALEHLAKQSKDPERVDQLQKTAEEVKKFTPKAVTVAAAALKDPKPNNTTDLAKVAQQLPAILDFAEQLAAPAPDVEVAAVARGLLEQVPKLTSAAPPGAQKEKHVEETAKKINDLLPYLAPAAKDYIAKHPNPQTKAKLTEALKAAETSIPEAVQAAKASAKNPKDEPNREKAKKNVDAAEQALHNILQGCGAEALAHSRKQKDDVAMLDVLATCEEPKQVADVEKQIVKRQPKLVEAALAQSNGTASAPDIAKEVQHLDELLPAQIQAAQEVVNKPSADPPKKKLKNNTQEMTKALDNIAADVQKISPPTQSKNAPSIQDLLEALHAANDPKGEQKLQNILEYLQPALEQMVQALPADDPEQQEAEKIAALGQDLQDAINKVVSNASKVNNPEEVKKLTADLPKKLQDFVKAVEPFVDKYIEDPEVKALLKDALDDLAALLPEIISTATDVAKNPRDPRPKKKLEDLGNAGNKNVNFIIKKVNRPPEEKQQEAIRKFPKAVQKVLDDIDKGLPWSVDNLKKVIRDMNPPNKDEGPNYLGNRNIAEAIKKLEEALAEKNKKPSAGNAPHKPYEEAKKFFENVVKDPKNQPKPNPKNDIVAKVKDVANLLDRLEAAALAPKVDPTKLSNIAKAIGNKVAPLIQAAKKEAETIKDPEVKKKLETALKNLEKELPRLVNEGVKPVIANPTEENREKLRDIIDDIRAPLEELAPIFVPDPVVDVGKQEKAEALKIAKAARNGDPKGAQDALKAVKDLNSKFVRAAKERASQAPPKLKDHIENNIKDLEDKLKALEPAVLEFAKKPNDKVAQENVAALARGLTGPLDSVIEDLQLAPQAIQSEQEALAKQILASIKAKNIKKIDPSHLLKISKHLAGLLSDMVSKTGDQLQQNQAGLSDRAKAALELEKLLASLDKEASKNPSGNYSSQSIDALLATLNLSTEGGKSGGGAQTHLSQQVSAVAKQIRTKTTGSIEGTPLHAISQGLAADLQKFADADSGNSRSELIVLGRAISANIVRLADELKRLAGACTDPVMQEKLLRNAQVLRNYSTQLKIMASVRAASPSKGKDSSSDQLVVLTQNLAAVIGDATNAVSIMKQTKKGTV